MAETLVIETIWDELKALRSILHAVERHPDFEYETTKGGRKLLNENEPPEGEGWVRNYDKGEGFSRFEFHEESYWRRRKIRTPADNSEPPIVATKSGSISVSLTGDLKSIRIDVMRYEVFINRVTGELTLVRRSEDAGNPEVHL